MLSHTNYRWLQQNQQLNSQCNCNYDNEFGGVLRSHKSATTIREWRRYWHNLRTRTVLNWWQCIGVPPLQCKCHISGWYWKWSVPGCMKCQAFGHIKVKTIVACTQWALLHIYCTSCQLIHVTDGPGGHLSQRFPTESPHLSLVGATQLLRPPHCGVAHYQPISSSLIVHRGQGSNDYVIRIPMHSTGLSPFLGQAKYKW